MTIWQIWWLALAIKTILLPIIPITPDEAYYFAWSRHPALSYFDHPPFIAWIMTFAQPLWKTAVGIRWPGVIFSHLGFIPWIKILQKLKFSERAQIFWILSLLVSPLTGLGGFVITPDVPLVFFWSCGLWALLWLRDKPSTPRWMLVGALVGLGLLSKYVMVLFGPGILIWLWWEGKLSELKKPGIWLGGLVALLFFSPVILWNYQNEFASFIFQAKHGLVSSQILWNYPLEYIGTQFAMLNPFLAIVTIWVLRRRFSQHKMLTVFTLIPFAFFFLTSFRARVEANWPVCAYPSFMAIFATVIDIPEESKRWTSWIKTGLAVSSLFCLLVISHTVHPWLPLRKDKDHTEITREWKPDVDAVQDLHPLYARSYQVAAFHSYFRPANREVFKLAGIDRTDAYDFMPQSKPTGPGYIILKADDQFPPGVAEHYRIQDPVVLPSNLVVYKIFPK